MASSSKPPTKTEIFNGIAEATGLNRKQVSGVFEAMAAMIDQELSKGKKTDAKSFTIPGLCKIVTKFKPAEKGGEKKTNPFTGEEMITKPKDASQQVKIRPLKALKDMVND
jgi:nucleoid DNA-binding protein